VIRNIFILSNHKNTLIKAKKGIIMLKYKVIIAGAKNVGKTSLILRFCENIFKEDMKATIGVAFKRKRVNITYKKKKITLELNIWDFGGEEKYRTLFPSYAHGASAALLLFDISNKNSLFDIENWVSIIDKNAKPNVIKLLIATKIDLKHEIEVKYQDALDYCKKHNYNWCNKIIKTSSKTGTNIEKTFKHTAKEIVKKNLRLCENCKELFNKRLKYCQYCGKEIEAKTLHI
jgi:small GTP-binding protein